MDGYDALPMPAVVFHGSAAEAEAKPFVDVIQLSHNEWYYFVVVSVPQALTLDDGFNFLHLGVTAEGQVHIRGQTSPGSIFVSPTKVYTRRMQLCPNKPWGLSFALPGPVDVTDTEISSSAKWIKLTARKQL